MSAEGVREFIDRIAAYRTTEELLGEVADDDAKRDLYEDAMTASADALDEAIISARSLKDKEDVVWTLQIDHKHGIDISVHGTYESAWQTVVGWAAMYWDDDAAINIDQDEPLPLPEKEEQVVDNYFDGNEYEFYAIERQVVNL